MAFSVQTVKNYILHFCKNAEGLGKRSGNTFALQTPAINGCPHLLRCGVSQMEAQGEKLKFQGF